MTDANTGPARPGQPDDTGPVPLPRSAATPVASSPSAASWLRRWRRQTQPTPPDFYAKTDSSPDRRPGLLDHGPFQVGFFGALGVLAAVGLVLLAGQLQTIIVLVLLSLVIALGLNPAVEFLHRRGLRRGLCVLVVILALLIILGLAGWAIVPVASVQINQLINLAPDFLNNLLKNPQIAQINQQFDVVTWLQNSLTSGNLVTGAFGGIMGATTFVANMVFSVVITVVFTLYFLISLPTFKEVIYQLAPASRRSRVRYLANEMLTRIGGYVSRLFIVALIDSTMSLILLNVVGLFGFPQISGLSLAVAAIVAILSFVPLVGAMIWIVMIVLICFAFSPVLGVIVLLYLLAWQQVDAYLIQPRIFSNAVKVPGVLIILAAVSGGLLLGVIGAILAVPIMAACMLLYREVLIP
ncbi:MAG: AI-2E family transporter, partial [Micrococcales bacterium]|nr:AI-2E family transporter [Micrococcales bacterium]